MPYLTLSRRAILSSLAASLAGGARLLRPGTATLHAQTQRPASTASGTRLLLLGTQGGPNFNLTRGESANAVTVDGVTYLVDCGYGTLGALVKAGISHRDISQIFLTHLHDDHTADLPAMLVRQWTNGRTMPTTVHGPYGTSRMVDAVLAFGEANATIRLVDEGRSIRPKDLLRSNELQATTAPADVYRDERIRVRSVECTHYPEESKRRMPYRALSYRFDTRNRSIVFSGDTAYSSALVTLARDADVFVCEAMEVTAMRKAFDGMVAKGQYADNPEGIWRHIVGTHTPVEEAGRMATEARVKTLVLSHLVPGALGDLNDEAYLAAARKTFSGRIVVGRDQLAL